MKRAGKATPINIFSIREVRIVFDANHLPSNVIVDLHNGQSIEAGDESLFSWKPNRRPDCPLYDAYEAIFGTGNELRIQAWIPSGRVPIAETGGGR